ncbi:MAG TPA: ATP-binding cassette domain-containing protein [Opitutaceae bacterium]|nr:ATP-binding cassette domain-containing protein [Opitutaceae bacterium]
MNLRLENLRLPFVHFSLEMNLTLTSRVTGLFGPSGAGKTSVLELVAGLRRPRSGRVALDDTVLTDAAAGAFVPPERRGIGYLPQDDALFPHLSVRENLLYGARAPRLQPPALSYAHVTEVLEIDHLAGRATAALSGGERQRVALGRTLLSAPRLLLLDEPLARLDGPLKERLLPYLMRVRDEFGLPMVYVTHSADEVVALCDHAVVLEQGRVIRQGAVRDLFAPAARPGYELRGTD